MKSLSKTQEDDKHKYLISDPPKIFAAVFLVCSTVFYFFYPVMEAFDNWMSESLVNQIWFTLGLLVVLFLVSAWLKFRRK